MGLGDTLGVGEHRGGIGGGGCGGGWGVGWVVWAIRGIGAIWGIGAVGAETLGTKLEGWSGWWIRLAGGHGDARLGRIGIRDFAGEIVLVDFGVCEATRRRRVGGAAGVAARGGLSFGQIAPGETGGCLGEGGWLGTTDGFDVFCGGSLGGGARLRGGVHLEHTVGIGCRLIEVLGRVFRLVCLEIGEIGGVLGFGLDMEARVAGLLGGAVAELRAVLASGGGEVAIFGTVEVCPGVQDSNIFGCFYRRELGVLIVGLAVHGDILSCVPTACRLSL